MGVRPRDFLWEALVEVCEADASEMTKNERGKYNAALKQLKDVGATPDEIRRRAWKWRQEYPNLRLTPTALCNRWSSLKRATAPAAAVAAAPSSANTRNSPEEEVECRHGRVGKCEDCAKAWRDLVGGLSIGGLPEGV